MGRVSEETKRDYRELERRQKFARAGHAKYKLGIWQFALASFPERSGILIWKNIDYSQNPLLFSV